MTNKEANAERHAAIQRWLCAHGDSLYRYAFLHTRHRETAEDIVQETLLGALRTPHPPDGRASEKTWLFGILKHKLADHVRSRQRAPLDQRVDPTDDTDIETDVFLANGRWREPTSAWGDPLKYVEAKTFWRSLKACLGNLPDAQSEMFVLREIEELPLEDAAEIAGVSATNVYVLLHRARLALRQCLQHAGFGQDSS
ncbi:MAG TPA: sigma-70 family RNA polymerase sigma factor [Acidiferrobacter sp.]|nr:sigma-70 family RNA polymerase sigma factor [Acidiferrobacter sp.]